MARGPRRARFDTRARVRQSDRKISNQDDSYMRLMLTNGRNIPVAALGMLLMAAPVFAQTAGSTPIPGPALPPGVHFAPPLHPIPPTMRQKADATPSTPVPQFPPTPEQLKLATAYIKAINDGDEAALRKLIAPKALACFNKNNEIFLDEYLERQMLDQIAQPYQITIEEFDPSDMGKTRLFTLPVPPTHQMNISTKLRGRDVTIGRPIAYQDGRWYEIAPCPTDLGLRHSIQREKHIAMLQNQALQLYNSLTPAFKKSLYQLLLQDKGGEACQKTSAQLKVDLQTGCRVAQVMETAMEERKIKPDGTAAAKLQPSPVAPAKAAAPKK
jgi:hypothetical protein